MINVMIFRFVLYVAKCELNKHAIIIVKLSPQMAATPTSFAYSLKKSSIALYPAGKLLKNK